MPFQRDALRLLRIPESRLLPFDGGDWRFRTLYFPSISNFSARQIAWLRGRVLGETAVSPQQNNPPVRLYISRSDASTRRLVNEADLLPCLQAHGFQIVTLTGMPFPEQVALFARAEIILGPHGSGLTNVVFAPPQATLVELMPHDQVNHCFWLLANSSELSYTFLSGNVLNKERDFLIDINRLDRLLTRLI